MSTQKTGVPVDNSVEGIRAAIERQLYPAADTAKKQGVERTTRGGLVSLPLGQVEALLAMVENSASWQIGYDKGFIAGYDQRDCEVKAALA